MDPTTKKLTLAAAGGKKDPLYVDDVFNTFAWDGTGSNQTIINGIDLAGEGGLVWSKNRKMQQSHLLNDSARGKNSGTYYDEIVIDTNALSSSGTPWGVSSFNSNGFTLGGNNFQFNSSPGNAGTLQNKYVSWTFRKAPGFFDCVTYAGNGTAGRTVAHSLGSVPGFMVVKKTNWYGDWIAWHKDIPSASGKYIQLNEANGPSGDTSTWNNTNPTASVFTVGTHNDTNQSGQQYVAYLFAHDVASFGEDNNESIIKCGSYTGNAANPNFVNLGFEPQWVMIKSLQNATNNWEIFDSVRGTAHQNVYEANVLSPNINNGESLNAIEFTSTGFTPRTASSTINGNGQTFIYIAIRRSHKPPEAGTEVFHAHYGYNGVNAPVTTGFPFDIQIAKEATNNNPPTLVARGLGITTFESTNDATPFLQPSNTNFFTAYNTKAVKSKNVNSTGFGMIQNYANNLMLFHSFKRAAKFMDAVVYDGGLSNNISHSLGVTPEFYIVKSVSNASANWWTSHVNNNSNMALNTDLYSSSYANSLSVGSCTDSTFYASSGVYGSTGANSSGQQYLALLFATLPGVSKCGTYSGTGNNINVDCGFTNGARFILIKRTNAQDDWYVYDYAHGITNSNDKYIRYNDPNAEVTNTDYIDPLNAGFTVTSSAPAGLNTNGGTYIYLAIA